MFEDGSNALSEKALLEAERYISHASTRQGDCVVGHILCCTENLFSLLTLGVPGGPTT